MESCDPPPLPPHICLLTTTHVPARQRHHKNLQQVKTQTDFTPGFIKIRISLQILQKLIQNEVSETHSLSSTELQWCYNDTFVKRSHWSSQPPPLQTRQSSDRLRFRRTCETNVYLAASQLIRWAQAHRRSRFRKECQPRSASRRSTLSSPAPSPALRRRSKGGFAPDFQREVWILPPVLLHLPPQVLCSPPPACLLLLQTDEALLPWRRTRLRPGWWGLLWCSAAGGAAHQIDCLFSERCCVTLSQNQRICWNLIWEN